MTHVERLITAIEIMHHGGADVGRADCQAGAAAVDQVEIRQLRQRAAQRRGAVIASVLRTERPGGRSEGKMVRGEEPSMPLAMVIQLASMGPPNGRLPRKDGRKPRSTRFQKAADVPGGGLDGCRQSGCR